MALCHVSGGDDEGVLGTARALRNIMVNVVEWE